MNSSTLSKLLACSMLFLCGQTVAANRALLIGVGEYQDPSANLVGIDLDLAVMTRVAKSLGYRDQDIRVLADDQATLANVESAMGDWLVDGVNPADRVLIYYSGHGTQVIDKNGDEKDDGADEALVLHDVKVVGDGELQGVLVDDRFFELMQRIPSKNIYVMVDACHSGTGFRSLTGRLSGAGEGTAKAYEYPGMPRSLPVGSKGIAFVTENQADNFAALMASADDEESIATEIGSVFTLAVGLAVDAAVESGSATTLQELHAATTEFIRVELADHPDIIFNPQLGGSSQLAQSPLAITPDDTRRESLQDRVDRYPGLTVRANRPSFQAGDLGLKISVKVPDDGYLNIITVNPHDQAVVLFPNQFNKNNYVMAGEVSLPTREMNFNFRAREPLGTSIFVALLTDSPLNLYESGVCERDALGDLAAVFCSLSAAGTRSIDVVARGGQFKAGSTTIEVIR